MTLKSPAQEQPRLLQIYRNHCNKVYIVLIFFRLKETIIVEFRRLDENLSEGLWNTEELTIKGEGREGGEGGGGGLLFFSSLRVQ